MAVFEAQGVYIVFLLLLVALSAIWVVAWWFTRRTLELARQGEERYRGIFTGTSVGIVLIDAEGRLLEFNQAWAMTLGYDAETLRKMKWQDIPAPAERVANWAAVEKLLKGELQRLELEMSFHHQDGSLRWADLNLSRVAGVGGRVQVLCAALDITSRRKTEEDLKHSQEHLAQQLKFQELLLDSIPLPVFVKDSSGRYIALNQAFCRFLGKDGGEIRGRTVYEIAPSDLARIYHQADLDLMQRGGKQVYETSVETKEEGRRQVMFHKAVFTLPDGRVGGIIGLVLDVTDRKALEEKLSLAKEKAESSARSRTEFLAVMSHEIRTPMNGLMGMIQLLESSELTQRQQNFIRIMRGSCEALLALLDDILDATKLDTGHFVFERIDFDLKHLVENLGQLMSVRAEEKGLTFGIEIPPAIGWVKGDPGRLRQILLNLVGNAVKFTQSGGVKIKLDTPEETNGNLMIRFSVIDTGIGIPESSLKSIFTPFTQADSSIARRFGGTGLGLAIVKRLVEGMGGVVGASSRPGEGSVFHFMLPFSMGEAGQPETSIARRLPSSLAVMVVDDVEINRLVAGGLLELDGHKVIHAASGEEALAKLAVEPVDIVLMDLLMPEMDGYETARRIRALPVDRLARMPILAMTANVHHSDRERAESAGMNGFLPKPLNLNDIRAALGALLAGNKGAESLCAPAHKKGEDTDLLDQEKLALWFSTFGADKLKDLIGTYRSSSADNFRSLSAALDVKDVSLVGRVAHKIAGAAANLGFSALHRQGIKAENAAKAGRDVDALSLGGDMAEIQAQSWQALELWLAKAQSEVQG
ncbi:putative Multi-sensor hybrid histidine kinase [Rhodospirillaceae bacterium LM-1]|nr:putative Multi-sensor hybrid histidine kinase [Rhodospirillaceae bacterium LM-1]